MADERVKPNFCPLCGYYCDSASHAMQQGAKPTPGDVSVCLACGGILFFTKTMGLRRPESGEVEGLPVFIQLLLSRIQEVRKVAIADRIINRIMKEKGN